MLHREIIAVCSEMHRKLVNTLFGQNVKEYLDFAGCTSYLHKVHSSFFLSLCVV